MIPLINPAFLWAAFAITIPVIIHLSRKRKFKELQLGTLRFLQQVERRRRFRMRVENWFLLMLRALAVLLLALLFARPHLEGDARAAAGDGGTLVLLDASGSVTDAMRKEALRAAKRVAREGGGVTFGQFSDEVEELDSLEAYEPRAGAPSRFDLALDWALERSATKDRKISKVVMIGHLALDSLPLQPLRVWPPGLAVDVVPLEPPSAVNAAVREVTLITPFATDQMEVEARVTPSPAEREVIFEAEGLRLAQRVPPGIERVTFRFRPSREEVRGWISLVGGDPWPADDRRPFAASWTEPKQILLIDGFPGSTPFEGQAYFISKALAASGAAHGKSPFQPVISYGMENRQGPGDLQGVDAVALCGVTEISLVEARLLAAHVAQGGGLMVIPDERWSAATAAPLVELGLFPEGFSFGGGSEVRQAVTWDRDHPALSGFDTRDGGDLRDLSWRDAFLARSNDEWTSLITLDGGAPVLLEKRRTDESEGRVMVLAHPLTRAWTDLPQEPLFVPMVKNLFRELSGLEAVDRAAVAKVPGIRESRPIGHHTLADGAVEVLAPDPRECLVAAAGVGEFRRAFGLSDTAAGIPPAPADARVDAATDRQRQGEWWPWLAAGLLVLLTLECAVATRRSLSAASSEATPA